MKPLEFANGKKSLDSLATKLTEFHERGLLTAGQVVRISKELADASVAWERRYDLEKGRNNTPAITPA